MHIEILSLFPGFFHGPLDVSILKRAQENGLLQIDLVDIRSYSQDRYHKVDDRPYGGGPGMVMMADPVVRAIRDKKKSGSRVIYLTPQGEVLNAKKCRSLAKFKHLILLCGHYEGIDERAVELEVDEQISIGDFVLTNGCLASLVLLDALVRFIPGVLGHADGACVDSFEGGLLDWPHYTRPEEFEGKEVPKVLLSGDHQQIELWRRKAALEKTKKWRPDLYQQFLLKEDKSKAEDSEKRATVYKRAELVKVILGCFQLTRSVKFYKEVLQLKIIEKSDLEAKFDLAPITFTLVQTNAQLQTCQEQVFFATVSKQIFRQLFQAIETKKIGKNSVDVMLIDKNLMHLSVRDPDGYQWLVQEEARK